MRQRTGTLYRAGRTREETRRHLRRGWYGGKGKWAAHFMPCDVHGFWKTAKIEMGLWIAQDMQYNRGIAGACVGLSGSMGALVGAVSWTTSPLLIRDMDDEPLCAHADIAQAEAEAGGLDGGV